MGHLKSILLDGKPVPGVQVDIVIQRKHEKHVAERFVLALPELEFLKQGLGEGVLTKEILNMGQEIYGEEFLCFQMEAKKMYDSKHDMRTKETAKSVKNLLQHKIQQMRE